jgi:hypothetical protein
LSLLENALFIVGGAVFVAAYVWFTRPRMTDEMLRQRVAPGSSLRSAPKGPRIPLETQIAALAEVGVTMNPGVTVDDLLHSYPREEYEIGPWHCLLFMYGSEIEREPWGRLICDGAWNFDTECVEGPGSYVRIVRELARVAGVADKVTAIADHIDMNATAGDVTYVIAGAAKAVPVAIKDDWADPDAVADIMLDLEALAGGRRFWGADNGQASVVFALTDEVAARVNALTGGLLVEMAA